MGNLVSPNEMMAKAKEMMLDGREPGTTLEWMLIVNFIAFNSAAGLEVEICKLMKKLYDIPLDDDEIVFIAEEQAKRY